MKNAAAGRDATLRNFENRDLGYDIVSAGTAVVRKWQKAFDWSGERPDSGTASFAPPPL